MNGSRCYEVKIPLYWELLQSLSFSGMITKIYESSKTIAPFIPIIRQIFWTRTQWSLHSYVCETSNSNRMSKVKPFIVTKSPLDAKLAIKNVCQSIIRMTWVKRNESCWSFFPLFEITNASLRSKMTKFGQADPEIMEELWLRNKSGSRVKWSYKIWPSTAIFDFNVFDCISSEFH